MMGGSQGMMGGNQGMMGGNTGMMGGNTGMMGGSQGMMGGNTGMMGGFPPPTGSGQPAKPMMGMQPNVPANAPPRPSANDLMSGMMGDFSLKPAGGQAGQANAAPQPKDKGAGSFGGVNPF